MEPLAISGALLATVQLASSCVRIALALRAVKDDKFDELYWRMELEKARTLEWAKRLAASNYTPPRSQLKQFENLLHGLASRFRDLEATLSKVYPQGISERGMGIRMMVLSRRLLFEFGKFDELKQTLSAIQAMNDYLAMFDPPVSKSPTISPPPSFLKSIEATPEQYSAADIQRKDLNITSNVSTTDYAPQGTSRDSGGLSISRAPSNKPLPFFSTYQLGLKILERLPKASPKAALADPVSGPLSRLQLWGAGLFQDEATGFGGELDLQKLWMTPAGHRHRLLGLYVMRTLISILISEREQPENSAKRTNTNEITLPVFILEAALPDLPEHSPHRKSLTGDKFMILLTLADEDVADLARQRFEEIYPSWDDVDSESEFDYETRETTNLGSARTGWEEHIRANPPTIPSCLEDIEAAVECLYIVLPSICSCRQSYTLDFEAKQAQTAADSEQVYIGSVYGTPPRTDSAKSNATYFRDTETPGTTPPASINFDDHKALIQSNLSLAKELVAIFQSEENFYRRNGKKIRKFSPELEKEVKRLEDYYASLTSPGGHVPVTREEMQAGLAQSRVGMQMITYLYAPSTVNPKKAAGSVNSGGLNVNDGVVQSVEEHIATLLKEFTTSGFHLLAQAPRAASISVAEG